MKCKINKSYVIAQFRDMHKGGVVAVRYKVFLLLKKIEKVLLLILILPIYLFPLVIIRCIRPWLLVRLGEIESSGIGHLSLPIEIYICEAEKGLHNPSQKYVDIWCAQNIVSNMALLKKWKSKLTIWPRWLIKPLILLNRLLPWGGRHVIAYRYTCEQEVPWQQCDIYNVLKSTPSHVVFSKEEEVEGSEVLKQMGIEEGDPTICYMARDRAYYSEDHSKWDHRNSSIHTITQAMNGLTCRGYKAIRMGSKVDEKLHSTNSSIIDYATNGMRTELLDLFLISRCKFMVSTATGLDNLAAVFRRPVVYVNFAEFGNADWLESEAIFIPKKFWSIERRRFLTFSEIFQLGAHLFTMAWHYKREKIQWVDNDVDEIRATVIEMEQRLSGKWTANPEDENLQNYFRTLWPLRRNGRPLKARIGAEFLRSHPELLG